MRRVLVTPAPFDVAAALAALSADAGGVASFIGIVREQSGGRKLAALMLEHYPGMTEKALETLAAEAESRWPLLGCTLIHRVGRLTPGETIVLVATASRHRAAALESTAFLIDRLKTGAPFWKAEEFCEGGTEWVAARPEDDAASRAW